MGGPSFPPNQQPKPMDDLLVVGWSSVFGYILLCGGLAAIAWKVFF